jgi:hypothetical protein
MNSARPALPRKPTQAATGIAGFDEITGGGLPRRKKLFLLDAQPMADMVQSSWRP